jgi:thioredoxin reductase (NADPH)
VRDRARGSRRWRQLGGQAALFLSRSRTTVHMNIRRTGLSASMSRYLVDRIERNPRIVVWPSTQVAALTGTEQLEAVRLRRGASPKYQSWP